MTQLNLSGRQSSSKQQNTAAQPEGESIKNQTVGALGALAMFAAVIVIGSCSHSSKPVATQQPIQPTAPVSAPAVATLTPPPAPVQAKAKPKKHRAATLSYVNRQYGVSFDFPRQFSLKSGDQAQLSWGDLGPFQMDFAQPGGVTLAGVEVPADSYPATDFKSAFVTLSVNPGVTSEACAQFAFPEANAAADPSSTEKTGKVKIGALEFSEVENSTAGMMKQTDARYYHAFSNGACYEFALGVGTDGNVDGEGIKPVDRDQVFGKLEKILASVKLQPAVVRETEPTAPSAGVTGPAESSTPPSNAPANTVPPSSVNDRIF
jgi:hypothetical protein